MPHITNISWERGSALSGYSNYIKKMVKFGFLSEIPWLIYFIYLKEHSGPQLSDGQCDSSNVRCLKPGVPLENLGQRILPSVNIVSWCENNQTILVH